MRITGMVLIALFTFWAGAQAQVAAPQLNPLPFTPSSSWNPAVLSWDGPSRIGGGFADSSLDFSTTGFSLDDAATGDGNALRLQYVGESLSFGLDYWTVNMEFDALLGGGDTELNQTRIGLSFQMDDLFSIGAGQVSGENLFGTSLETKTRPLAGATLRLGETFYLGISTGTETVEEEDTSVAGSAVEGDHTATSFGVAYHMRDGENGLHVEVWKNETDGINTATLTSNSTDFTGVILEVVFSNILLGYESITGEEVDPATGSVDEEADSTTISVGWVPMEGLQIVVSLNELEIFEPPLNQTVTFNILFAGVTWAF